MVGPELSMTRDHLKPMQDYLLVAVCLFSLSSILILPRAECTSKPFVTQSVQLPPAAIQFVIADLDGDQIPDLASVELGNFKSTQTSYSICLRFGAGTQSAIGVEAPFGGLRVVARDVNGDDHIDLILTSNLDERFIEVLLNDGHGNFSQAAAGDYSEPLNETPFRLNGPFSSRPAQVTLASFRSTFSEEGVRGSDLHGQVATEPLLPSDHEIAPRPRLRPCPGRAPPRAVAFS